MENHHAICHNKDDMMASLTKDSILDTKLDYVAYTYEKRFFNSKFIL